MWYTSSVGKLKLKDMGRFGQYETPTEHTKAYIWFMTAGLWIIESTQMMNDALTVTP